MTAPPVGGVRRRRAGSGILAVAILLAAAAGSIVGTVAWAHTVSGQSAYTQAHGMPDRGSVVLVKSSLGKVWLEVRLDAPVDDEGSCNLYVPHGVSLKPGDDVSVLVDPQHPSYCEIPGDPYGASEGREIMAFGVAAALVFSAPVVVGTIQGRRRARRLRRISR